MKKKVFRERRAKTFTDKVLSNMTTTLANELTKPLVETKPKKAKKGDK